MSSFPENNPTPPTKPATKKPDILGIVFFLLALGLACYTSFGEHWPTTKLIEIQAKIFDRSYYPKLTFLLTLLVFFLPLIVIKVIIDKVKKKKDQAA